MDDNLIKEFSKFVQKFEDDPVKLRQEFDRIFESSMEGIIHPFGRKEYMENFYTNK